MVTTEPGKWTENIYSIFSKADLVWLPSVLMKVVVGKVLRLLRTLKILWNITTIFNSFTEFYKNTMVIAAFLNSLWARRKISQSTSELVRMAIFQERPLRPFKPIYTFGFHQATQYTCMADGPRKRAWFLICLDRDLRISCIVFILCLLHLWSITSHSYIYHKYWLIKISIDR